MPSQRLYRRCTRCQVVSLAAAFRRPTGGSGGPIFAPSGQLRRQCPACGDRVAVPGALRATLSPVPTGGGLGAALPAGDDR
jgi:hypothetical protein